MPRVDQYKNHHFSDYNYQPSTSGTLLFLGIAAVVILVALLWSYAPPITPEGMMMDAPAGGSPAITQPVTPPSPATR